MEKTVRIASDTSIRQLRAYVIVDRVGINGVITNSQPTVTVEFKNSGQTPAYDVTSWISIGLSKFPLTYSIPEEINFPTMKGSKDIIFLVGGKVLLPATMSSPLTIEEIDQLNTGTHAIYFIGKIIYKDAFGIERFTKFKFFCNKNPGGPLAMHPYILMAMRPINTHLNELPFKCWPPLFGEATPLRLFSI